MNRSIDKYNCFVWIVTEGKKHFADFCRNSNFMKRLQYKQIEKAFDLLVKIKLKYFRFLKKNTNMIF